MLEEEGWVWAEDEDGGAAVVVNGEVKLVFSGMGQLESVAHSGVCVRTVALGFYYVVADAEQVVTFFSKKVKYEQFKTCRYGCRKRILHQNMRTGQ